MIICVDYWIVLVSQIRISCCVQKRISKTQKWLKFWTKNYIQNHLQFSVDENSNNCSCHYKKVQIPIEHSFILNPHNGFPTWICLCLWMLQLLLKIINRYCVCYLVHFYYDIRSWDATSIVIVVKITKKNNHLSIDWPFECVWMQRIKLSSFWWSEIWRFNARAFRMTKNRAKCNIIIYFTAKS